MSEEVKLYVAYRQWDPYYQYPNHTAVLVCTTYVPPLDPEWRVLTISGDQKDYYLSRNYGVFDNYWLAYGEVQKKKQNVAA
jgi:hypothetical protein